MRKQEIEYLNLWKEFKQAKTNIRKNEVKKKLAEIYYPIVEKHANNMARKLDWKISSDELASYGVDGLYTAIERFSPDIGVTFACYSSLRIKGSMIDGMRKDDVIPRSVRIHFSKIEKARDELYSEKGSNITEKEILQKAGIDEQDFVKNLKKYIPISMSSTDGTSICGDNMDDFKQDVNDMMVDLKTISVDSNIIRKEFFNKLVSNEFTRDEQWIIYLYYYEGYTMDLIGEKLHMSESRISQIHKNILPRLKNKILKNPKYFAEDIKKVIGSCNDSSPLF